MFGASEAKRAKHVDISACKLVITRILKVRSIKIKICLSMFCNENGQLRWQYIFEYLTHATQVIFRIACRNPQCLIILELKKIDKCRIPNDTLTNNNTE